MVGRPGGGHRMIAPVPPRACTASLLLVIALAIKLDSRGPVFFRQERLGQYSRPFQILSQPPVFLQIGFEQMVKFGYF